MTRHEAIGFLVEEAKNLRAYRDMNLLFHGAEKRYLSALEAIAELLKVERFKDSELAELVVEQSEQLAEDDVTIGKQAAELRRQYRPCPSCQQLTLLPLRDWVNTVPCKLRCVACAWEGWLVLQSVKPA